MKKIIIGFSGLLILAFVAVLFINAQNNPQEEKKPVTEMSKDCGACPSAAACPTSTDSKTAEVKKCDPAKCKEMGCDPAKCTEGKCDPATCKVHIASAKSGVKESEPAMCGGCATK